MEDYTKLLAELYSEFDPERVKQIGYFLEKYKGKEKQFYISQKAKYKDKKPISDSKKIIEEALARIKSQGETKPNMTEETDKEPKSSAGDPRNIKPIPKQASEEIKKELSENKRVSYSFGGEPKLGDKNKAEPSAASTEDKPKTWFGDDNNTSSNDSASEVNKLREENARKMRSFQEEDESSNSKSDKNWGSSASSKPNVKSEQSEKEDYALPKSKDFHPLDNDIKFNQKYFLYIFMMVILVISVAVFIFFIFIKQSGTKGTVTKPIGLESPIVKKPKQKIEEPKAEEKKDDIVIQKEAPKEVVAEKAVKEEPQKTDKQEPAPIKKEVVLIPKEEKEIKKTPAISNGNRLSKGAVDLPSYFVACSAVKTEALAINKTNQLTTLGFKSSYYWIPDFTPNGNTYFKVVVGPFKDRREAMRNLTRVQERVEFDAYVYELK